MIDAKKPRRDLYWLGEGLYRVSCEENKEKLCRCPDRFKHQTGCIWFAARKLLPEVQREIDRLDD